MTRRTILVAVLCAVTLAACNPPNVEPSDTTTTVTVPDTAPQGTGTALPAPPTTTGETRPTAPPEDTAPDTATTVTPTTTGETWWHPSGRIDWQIDLSNATIDLRVGAALYDIDGENNTAGTVQRIHTAGARALCYFDAGSIESYRPDYGLFPSQALSPPNPEWPDEQWLDIRHLDDMVGPTGLTPRQVLTARIDMCAAKGFDGVDPDMTEVHTYDVTFPTGGKPSAADNAAFVEWLAGAAHTRGLAVSLKNDVDQAAQLEPSVDMTINEECARYDECGKLYPFSDAGKPILHIEYQAARCPYTGPLAGAMSSIRKRLALGTERFPC